MTTDHHHVKGTVLHGNRWRNIRKANQTVMISRKNMSKYLVE